MVPPAPQPVQGWRCNQAFLARFLHLPSERGPDLAHGNRDQGRRNAEVKMAVSSVNSMISFQESQLIHMLAQAPGRARTEDSAENRRAWLAAGGQNLPAPLEGGGMKDPAVHHALPQDTPWEPIDPAFSPEYINALLSAMQTQQASLDTTMLVGSSSAGPGGRTLVDYLIAPEAAPDAANDDVVAGPSL